MNDNRDAKEFSRNEAKIFFLSCQRGFLNGDLESVTFSIEKIRDISLFVPVPKGG